MSDETTQTEFTGHSTIITSESNFTVTQELEAKIFDFTQPGVDKTPPQADQEPCINAVQEASWRKVYSVGDWITVFRNQGYRSAQILALNIDEIGDRLYLVEYHMPSRWNALNFITQSITEKTISDCRYKAISYNKIAVGWLKDMANRNIKWRGNSVNGQIESVYSMLDRKMKLKAPVTTGEI